MYRSIVGGVCGVVVACGLVGVVLARAGRGRGGPGERKGPPLGAGGAGPGGAGGGGGIGGPGLGAQGGGIRAQALFLLFDTNGDGAIVAQEFEAMVQVIKNLDVNGDGRVTPDEALALQGAVGGGRGGPGGGAGGGGGPGGGGGGGGAGAPRAGRGGKK